MENKKFFIALSFFYFLFFALIGDYVIFMPKLFSQYFTPAKIGIIFAMLPIARFLTPFVFIKKSLNKKDYILSIIVAFFASLLILSKNFYLILFSFFLIGASFAVLFPYIESIAIEKLSTKYGRARVTGSIGFMLYGIIFSYININHLIYFIILMFFTGLSAFYFKEDKIIKKTPPSKPEFFKDYKFWLGLIFMQISFGGFYNFFTIYLIKHGINKEYVGWLWGIGVMAEIIVFLTAHNFLHKLKPIKWIKISIFLTSIRWLILFLFANSLILIAASQLLHAFSFAIFHTSALLYINKTYKNKTLAQQFYAGIGYGLAAFLGSIISGFLYGENLFLYESLIALFGFLIML